jgi:hypothetical protein
MGYVVTVEEGMSCEDVPGLHERGFGRGCKDGLTESWLRGILCRVEYVVGRS